MAGVNSNLSFKSKEEEVVSILISNRLKISFAESCTGGLLASALIDVPDASKVIDYSVVTYSNEAKVKELGVSQESINKYGVVSEKVALEMAKGVTKKYEANIGVSTSGIAGPTGATDNKPLGMVCFGFYINGTTITRTMQFGDIGRSNVRKYSTEYAFKTLLELFEMLNIKKLEKEE